MPQAGVSLAGAFPSSLMSVALPQAAAPGPTPSSPVHGVWNRSRESLSRDTASAADRSLGNDLADVAAELIAETPQMQSRLKAEQARNRDERQEDAFDHRDLLGAAEPQSGALLAVRSCRCCLTLSPKINKQKTAPLLAPALLYACMDSAP